MAIKNRPLAESVLGREALGAMQRVAIYPGTFDPVTIGHLDVVARSKKVVDKLVIAVAASKKKSCLFSQEERVELFKGALIEAGLDENVEVKSFDGLLVNFAKELEIKICIRGIRVVSDFEYEFQLACVNSRMDDNMQTIFLPASENLQLTSSRMVKEVAMHGASIDSYVTRNVQEAIKSRV